MDVSHNAPLDKANAITRWVWYSSNAALKEGQAVCYNWDYTGDGATYSEPRRYNEVETPSFTNAQHFAGVSSGAYSAISTGQLIKIYVPGSICNICLGTTNTTVIGQGLLTFDVTDAVEGQFLRTGMAGEGSAVPLQSVTTDGTNQTCLAKLQTGPPSGGVEYVVVTDIATWVSEMIGGTTLLLGRDLSQDCVEEIADGTVEGTKRRFAVVTTTFSGGFNLQIDILNDDGVTLAGTGALAEVTIDAVGNNVTFEWKQGAWHNLGGSFTGEA